MKLVSTLRSFALLPVLGIALSAGTVDAAAPGAGAFGKASNARHEKVYETGVAKGRQGSSGHRAPGPRGGVANCGVCSYNLSTHTIYSLPPELFSSLTPQTTYTLALSVGKTGPGVSFDWTPSVTTSKIVEFPSEGSPSSEAEWVYLLVPGFEDAIPVPIVTRESPERNRS